MSPIIDENLLRYQVKCQEALQWYVYNFWRLKLRHDLWSPPRANSSIKLGDLQALGKFCRAISQRERDARLSEALNFN